MKKNYLISAHIFFALIFFNTSESYSQKVQTSGIGIFGSAFLSPVKTGKKYYAAGASVNLRNEENSLMFRFFGDMQFHDKVKIIDIGSTLRVAFTKQKLIYVGVSPYTMRVSTLKSTAKDSIPVSISKGFGSAHLGLQFKLSNNINLEMEGNYNYFYQSKVGGYGGSIGFTFYNDEILGAIASVFGGKN